MSRCCELGRLRCGSADNKAREGSRETQAGRIPPLASPVERGLGEHLKEAVIEAGAEYDCIVLGAGVAGLAAARVLAEAGKRVLVLEARNRVGGRLLTETIPGLDTPVELGAEFVHGRPPELLALLDEAGLATYETAGADMRFDQGGLRAAGDDDGAAFALLDELRETDPDRSFEEFLKARQAPEADARRARQYVEGSGCAAHRDARAGASAGG